MKLNQKIQAFLTKKKYKKHRLALRCMMSFMVALCVVGNLIMPAISMTLESLDPSYSLRNETITYLSSESTPPTDHPDAIDLTPTAGTQEKFEMNIEDEYENIIYNNFNGTVTGSGSTDNVEKVGLTFFLHYLKPEVSVTVNDAADLYLNLKDFLGSGTKFVLHDDSKNGDVLDETYFRETGNQSAGEYVFTEDGYILIYLTPEYIAYINSDDGDGSLEGTLTFTGTLSRSNDASGDQTFNIGGQQVTVKFPDKKAEISNKWGTVNETNGTITWTVEINNNDKLDLSSYNFTDTMLDQATSVTFNPSDVATFDTNTKKITFNSNSANSGTIRITYTTPVTNGQLAAGSVSNTATLTNGSDSSSRDSTVNLNDKKPVNITKRGVQDYTSGTYGGEITWTITLDNNRGISLDGYVLKDDMLAGASNITVSPAGSIGSDGTLTGVGNANKIIIKYQTTATPGETYNNKVSLSYPTGTENPNGNKPADDTEKQVTYDTESNLITLRKDGYSAIENGVGIVQWTITIGNPNKIDLTGYKVTDKMIAQAFADGYDVSVSAGATIQNNEIVFNSDSKNNQAITVTYKTKITSDELKNGVSNTATLTDNDNPELEVDAPKDVTFPTPHLSVNKSVSADYEKGTYGNTLEWTINIQSTYGVSLEDFIVKDAMLDNATTITISPSGTLTKNSDGVYTLTGVGDASNIQIKYTTEAVGGQNYSNTADVYYPGGGTTDDNKVELNSNSNTANKTYVDEGGLYGVSKWGNVTNQEDGEINWQITITPSGGINLENFEVYDAKFPVDANGNPDLNQITFNPSSAKAYATAYKNSDGKLTIKFDKNSEGNYFSDNVQLSYKEYLADGVSGEITNSVSNNKNNTVVSYPVTYTERNTLDKNLNGGNVSYDKTNAKIEKILSWTSSITYDGSLAGKTYTDTLSVNSTSSASHTITDAQLDAILIYARHYSWDSYPGTKLVAGTDYTVQNNGNTGFTITFLDTENTRNANYINISYNTTAVADAYTGSYDSSNLVTYTFGNKAQFNNNTDEDNKYVVNRQNPETHNTINLKAIKAWENADSITKPANVQMVLMHNVNNTNNTEWLPVKGSGTNYILSTYDNYSSTEGVYTITLTGTGNWWEISLNNIPQLDVFAKADGTPGEALNYRYKLAEIAPDGVTILDGNVYEYGDGYFQMIDNTNWNGVNYNNGELKITNKYYPEKSLKPRKIWEGDEGKSSQISSLTYQLQYSFTNSQNNDNEWYPVKKDDTTGEYVYDANGSTAGATIVTEELAKNGENGVTIDTLDNGNKIRWTGKGWTELPGMIIIDGNVKEIHYRVREVAVDGVEIPANKQFTVSDGYYTITSEGTDTITNKFTKTVNNTISAEKLWSDETHILDGIIVQLQRKGNDTNTWEAYGENVVLNAADNSWKTSWSDLPNQSVDTATGKVVTYTYRVVEIGYVKGNEQITGVIDNNSQFAVDENGYYEATYSTENNEWSYFDKNPKEFASGGSAYIKNTYVPVEFTELTPKKQWIGQEGSFENTDRPTSITLTLQRKTSADSKWEVVKNISLNSERFTSSTSNFDWSVNKNIITDVWTGEAVSGLPKSVIKLDSETGTFVRYDYEYRFVETSYTKDSTTTELNGVTKFKTPNGNYTITYADNNTTVINTYNESIGVVKAILDRNGNELDDKIDKDELLAEKSGLTEDEIDKLQLIKTIEVDDELYYVFNWDISFEGTENKNLNEVIKPIIDELPEGFILCIDKNIQSENTNGPGSIEGLLNAGNGYFVNPYYMYKDQFSNPIKPIGYLCDNSDRYGTGYICPGCEDCWSKFYTSTSSEYVFYNPSYTGDNLAAFSKPQISTAYHLCYSTMIKVSDFESLYGNGSKLIKNDVKLYEQTTGEDTGLGTSTSLKIIDKTPKDLITKTYEPTLIPGYVQFSLDINPEARNLSSGTTIDIQDLFKTLDYFDHDYQGGQWWTGANSDKLVDIIMNSVKLYEVDANGNRVELASNKYTLILDTGDNVDGGSALLKLQIPDETHIQVDYVYKLIANKNTPSVIRGCKSSTRVNGRYVTMAPGLVPPAGDKVKFTNVASLKTDSASDESAVSGTEYEISSSSGTISTNALPSIKKVNTGDYTINDLDAKFLFAKYENGKWYYATSIDEKKRTATWTVSGVSGSAVPTDETLAEIHVQQAYEIALDQNTLYKLVEIKVPDDYEGSNLGFADPATEFKAMILDYLNYGRTSFNNKDYSIFLNHYISTHYFVYNSTLAAYPSEVDPQDVMLIKAGGDIEIPNNQLIDINVKKQWINPTADVQDSSITVELYWSYTKSSTGYPSDMRLATVEELGLMQEDFSATKTIAVSDDAAEAWTQLPNGIGGKPIYYYIKETAYTIGGVTYTNDNDPENPSFKSESGDVCAFYPTYVGNAANDDETIINVNNSQQLMLKKVWKNSANEPMIVIPTDKVVVSIYGIDSDGAKTESPLFENIELSASNNWSADLTSLLASNNALYQYVAYEAEESAGTTLEDYVVSCTFNINSSTGEIVVTNKNTAPTDASVTVSKEWSDGSALHDNETIKVTLYQSDREIKNLSNLSGTIAALGTPKMSKINEDDTQEYEVFLNKDNNWTVTWTGLPLDNGDPSNPLPYYYYVLEDMSPTDTPEGFTAVNNADKYSAKYEITDGTATRTVFEVTNTRQAIVVEKIWKDDKNNIIENGDLPQSSIDVEVYTEGGALNDSQDLFSADGCHPDDNGFAEIANQFNSAINNYYNLNPSKLPTGTLDIVTIGDSITATDYASSGKDYPSVLSGLLSKNYTGLTINLGRDAASSREIVEFTSGNVNSNTDIICLLGGTNDMHQSDSSVHGDPEAIYDRLCDLIDTLQSASKAPNAVIFVATIPYFDFFNDNGDFTDGGKWWYNCNYGYPQGYASNQAYADACNALIDEYNKYILNIASEYSNVYAVDVCSALPLVRKDKYIGEATLTAENGWKTAIDIDDTDTSVKYYITEKNVPDGWQVTYSPESITLGSSTPITITNTKHIPITSVPVIKTWALDEGDESGRDAIQLSLLRSIDRINWEEIDATLPVPVKEDDTWTFTFTNLPAEDSAGNQYYYMVEEGALPGYTVKYGTVITEAVDDGTTKALTLTNTRAISLVVKKDWSDIEENDHINDIVKLKIYRTTKTEEISTESKLILDIVSKIALGTNEEEPKTISANKPLDSFEVKQDGNYVIAEIVNGQLKIKGVADGTAYITVTDEDGETAEIEVSVSSYNLFEKVGETETQLDGTGNTPIVLNLGDNTHQLIIKKSGVAVDIDDVTFSSSDTDVISVTDDGIISTLKPGEATITAKVGDFTFTQKYNAILHKELPFTISGADEVVEGETLQNGLTVNNNYGCTVVWSIADEHASYATIDQNGKVTGNVIANGVKVIAKITDPFGNSISAEHEIDVVNGDIFEAENPKFELFVDQTLKLSSATIMNQVSGNSDNKIANAVLNSDNTITVTALSPGTTTIKVKGNNWADEISFVVNVLPKFVFNSEKTWLTFGNSVELLTNKEDDDIQYSIISGSDFIQITDNIVTANDITGEAVVTAKNLSTGEIAQTTIVVCENDYVTLTNISTGTNYSLDDYDWKYIKAIGIKYTLQSGVSSPNGYVNFGNKGYNSNAGTLDSTGMYIYSFGTQENSTFNINNYHGIAGIEKVVLYYNAPTSSASFSLRNTALTLGDAGSTEILADEGIAPLAEDSRTLVSNLTFVAIAGNSETEVANVDIELSGTGADKWLAEIDNLPAQDENGNTYYYWVEEVPVFSNYEVSYLFRDDDNSTTHMINATQKSGNDVDIVVRNTKQNNVTVEMPSTGGEGTTNYYIIGIIVMLIGVAGLIVFKRRQIVKR